MITAPRITVGQWYTASTPISGRKPLLTCSRPCGIGAMDWPSSRYCVAPRNSSIPPSVTMNDGMPT